MLIQCRVEVRVVSRYREPQPPVVEDYKHLHKSGCLKAHFIPNISDLIGK